MELFILTDFNNIPKLLQNRGLVYLAERIISRLNFDEVKLYRRIRIRLYDGWYEQNSPTRKAQLVQANIRNEFPRRINISGNGKIHSIIVVVEMALSLIIEPNNHLFATYRQRGMPHGIRSYHPNSLGCQNSSCPLIIVHDFINNGTLNAQCCNLSSQDLIYRGEQKLVDTMVICDLIYMASENDCSDAVIVSSDDDFWPGIRTAIILGLNIIHIHTHNRTTPHFYLGSQGTIRYSQRIM